jgi:hypothetical protein
MIPYIPKLADKWTLQDGRPIYCDSKKCLKDPDPKTIGQFEYQDKESIGWKCPHCGAFCKMTGRRYAMHYERKRGRKDSSKK